MRLIHRLPEGERVCGIATLDDDIYVLRWKGKEHIEVYDAISFALQRCISVPNIRGCTDMVLSTTYKCLYIGDDVGMCVHRVELNGDFTVSPVEDTPTGLSITEEDELIVTCQQSYKVIVFSDVGRKLIWKCELPLNEMTKPWHAVQVGASQWMVVCYGETSDESRHVSMVSADGQSQAGFESGQFAVPRHVAVDTDNQFVFVADQLNQRVALLSPTLHHVDDVVSRDDIKWGPTVLRLDSNHHRLYVGDSDVKKDQLTSGRVVVFSL